MQVKEILLLLTDRWADWEASFAVAEINHASNYAVKTIATDKLSKVSIGGLRVEIDYSIEEYQDFERLAMVIMPGGFSWQENNYSKIVEFVHKVSALDIPVAAICGATVFLGRNGFFDNAKHTGDSLEAFQNQPGYNSQKNFVPVQVVVDKGFITANETASLEFAREIFKVLKIGDAVEINQWYSGFKDGMFTDCKQVEE